MWKQAWVEDVTVRDLFCWKSVLANWDCYIYNPPANSRARFLGHALFPVLPQILLLREKESLRSGKLCPRTIKDQTSKQDSFCAFRKYLDSGYAFLSIKQCRNLLNLIISEPVAWGTSNAIRSSLKNYQMAYDRTPAFMQNYRPSQLPAEQALTTLTKLRAAVYCRAHQVQLLFSKSRCPNPVAKH